MPRPFFVGGFALASAGPFAGATNGLRPLSRNETLGVLMIDSLIRMLKRRPADPRLGRSKLAAAAILAEMARDTADDDAADAAMIALRARFLLSGPGAAALCEIADGETPPGYEPGVLAQTIAEALDPSERREALRLLWRAMANDEGLKKVSKAWLPDAALRMGLETQEAADIRSEAA
jgi:hypothetical protein